MCLVWDSTMNMYKKNNSRQDNLRQLSKTMYAGRKKFGETRRHRRSLLLCKGGEGGVLFHAGRLFPSRRSVGRSDTGVSPLRFPAGRAWIEERSKTSLLEGALTPELRIGGGGGVGASPSSS